MPPYKKPAALQRPNKSFNYYLSKIRIDIEHAFGILKGRWKSLCGLRLSIMNNAQYQYAVEWIVACVVLHNILLEIGDDWNQGRWLVGARE